MDRTILHSDINSCYASIEHAEHPELAGLPLAVGGSVEDRHGIILAKDEAARRCGVKTGMAIWQAKALCPELTVLPPRMGLYAQVAGRVKEIYADYTDLHESFGIDESWLDISGCGDPGGIKTAEDIRRRVKSELGITVSVGVSWNKSFAKLGSDYKKPDAITVISRENFRGLVWPLPVESLLYVGRATSKKLRTAGICTVGELARTEPELLRAKLGRAGAALHACANGLDSAPVLSESMLGRIKSISNSTTLPRDLLCDGDILTTLVSLSESVAGRLRRAGLIGRCVTVSVRGTDLSWQSRQRHLRSPTDATDDLIETGMSLFRSLHTWPEPVRSLGIGISELSEPIPEQLDLFGAAEKRRQRERLDSGIDAIREKYGYASICRGCVLMPDSPASAAGERAVPAFVRR